MLAFHHAVLASSDKKFSGFTGSGPILGALLASGFYNVHQSLGIRKPPTQTGTSPTMSAIIFTPLPARRPPQSMDEDRNAHNGYHACSPPWTSQRRRSRWPFPKTPASPRTDGEMSPRQNTNTEEGIPTATVPGMERAAGRELPRIGTQTCMTDRLSMIGMALLPGERCQCSSSALQDPQSDTGTRE
jgi:hypothetical protein